MVTLAEIKADLPDWPDDVIEQWLLPHANRGDDTGWPPPEKLEESAWLNILGRRPLAWWKKVDWQLNEREIGFDGLCTGSRRIVAALIDGHIEGKPNIYSVGDNSKARFLSALRFIAKNGTLSKPLIAMQLEDGLSVIDGSHRMTALHVCQTKPEVIVQKGGKVPLKTHKIWIGTHADGEVPLD
jgi:hypothetical protein